MKMAWTMNQVKKTELHLLTVIKKMPRKGKSCLKNLQLLRSQKRERNLYLDQVQDQAVLKNQNNTRMILLLKALQIGRVSNMSIVKKKEIGDFKQKFHQFLI